MGWRPVLLAWLLLPSVLLAQTPRQNMRVVVHSQPPGAEVADQYRDILGKADQEMVIDFSKYAGGPCELHLRLPGYQESVKNVQPISFDDRHTLPDPVVLTKIATPYTAWLPALALLGLGGAATMAWRRNRVNSTTTQANFAVDASTGIGSLAGQTLGRFRLLDQVGAGGMATVYRALPLDAKDAAEAVAVKVMRRELLGDAEMAERFRREIQLTTELNHPNIVRTADWGVGDEIAYLAIEWMGGGTLRGLLQNEMVALEDIWDALGPICSALYYAHSRGIVHRDLKPENIMITTSGQLKVTDFGLARRGEADRVTATGAVLGTPAYMAPEQIQGDEPVPSMDQYAIGVIAYELLTGRLPFSEADPVQLIFKTMTEKPPAPSKFRALSPEIDRVILKMLEKQPAQRYPDLQEAARDLKGALCG